MPQVTASKLPVKLLALVFGAIAALAIGRTFLLNWQIIPPGYTGIKINRLVDRGITHENVVTGFVFYNPVQTAIIQYPTYVQRVIWTQDVNEGRALNEELTFNTKDAVPVNVDVAVSYQLDREKVPAFYTNFRADIGVDDEEGANGSVIFQVYADGVLVFDSGTMTGSSNTQSLNLNVQGVRQLKLVVNDAGDGNDYDHADWAGARLI